MKKLKIFIGVVALGGLVSCAKDYTCECTTNRTTTYNNGQGTTTTTTADPDVNTVVYKDVKKSNLPLSCKDNSQIYSSSNTSGTVTTTNQTESKTTCVLK